eukprot:maker-scaffold633_size121756-snap-gene-0.23 protein:Tk02260 transcript:maker-scaffold633_size121756-snap-gene-0.23-mRNA-1 annotation:"transforming growth factor-beta receptor type"
MVILPKIWTTFLLVLSILPSSQSLECICGSEIYDDSLAQPEIISTSVGACPSNSTSHTLKGGANLATCATDGVCFKSIHRSERRLTANYRCIPVDLLQPKERPLFCQASEKRKHEIQIKCCENEDLCNANLTVILPSVANVKSHQNNLLLSLLLIGPTCLGILLLFIAAVVWRNYFYQKRLLPLLPLYKASEGVRPIQPREEVPLMDDSTQNTTIKEMLESTCSGSGSGLPLLVQRSIARQIRLGNIIGQGRFGEVWKGQWHGESVAVKIFSTRDENSWFRESQIYQTVMLRHENILGFVATDNKDNGTWTQLWLVTDYHEYGSLFDYIYKLEVTPQLLISMALSIATGLAHLHMEIIGTQGKPAIAHRDLKSKNILVKKDLTCAIADLGLCVRHNSETDTVDLPNNNKVGTKRYLAPEILNGTLDMNHFDSWKRADVYSLGLVFWELSRRTSLGGIVEDFQMPYYEVVEQDPTIEEMKQVVCDKQIRPSCPNRWQNASELNAMSKLMKECWYQNSGARLTALRIKKTLAELQGNLDNINGIYPAKIEPSVNL